MQLVYLFPLTTSSQSEFLALNLKVKMQNESVRKRIRTINISIYFSAKQSEIVIETRSCQPLLHRYIALHRIRAAALTVSQHIDRFEWSALLQLLFLCLVSLVSFPRIAESRVMQAGMILRSSCWVSLLIPLLFPKNNYACFRGWILLFSTMKTYRTLFLNSLILFETSEAQYIFQLNR